MRRFRPREGNQRIRRDRREVAWQRDRLGYPEIVREATEGYRRDIDVIGDFITERASSTLPPSSAPGSGRVKPTQRAELVRLLATALVADVRAQAEPR